MLKEVKLPPMITKRRLKSWLKRNTDIPEKDLSEMAANLLFQLKTDGSYNSACSFFKIL